MINGVGPQHDTHPNHTSHHGPHAGSEEQDKKDCLITKGTLVNQPPNLLPSHPKEILFAGPALPSLYPYPSHPSIPHSHFSFRQSHLIV